MDLSQKLKGQGWHLTNDGLSKLPADIDKSDTRKVVHWLLNTDLRDIGAGALPTEISRKDDSIPGCIVLQISKIRNISAPKANEESKTAPRFLHIELTDGVTQIFALEYEHISNISLNTPPGTKLYLRSEKVPLIQGILALRPSDVQVLGGEVTALVEKWELTRTLQKYARGGRVNTGSSGPPPWIPFGQKIQQFNDDKNFKSLSTGNGTEKEKDAKGNEFDAMRNEAIAEAAKSGARKVFGGGNQQMLDHNVKKIIEKGFSEVEAKNALRATRNNLERALFTLKRRDDGRDRPENKESFRGPPRREAFKGSKKGNAKEDLNVVSAKPAGNVSLFDFLNDKLPTNTESSAHATTTTTVSTTSSNTRNERPSSKYDSNSKFNNGSSSGNQYQQSGSGSQNQNNTIPNNQSASGSTSSQQQQQSSRSSSKFENNISSSFANRNTPGSYAGDGGGDGGNNYRNRNRNERGERGERGARGGGGGSMSSYNSRQTSDYGRSGANSNQTANSNYNNSNKNQIRSSQERDRGGSSNYHHASSNHMESRETRPDGNRSGGNDNRSYKTPQQSSSRYSNKPGYTNNSSASNTNSTRKYSDNREAPHVGSDQMKELAEDTAKMKIDNRSSNRGGGSSRGSRNHPNQSHYQKQHQMPAASQTSVVQVVTQPAMQHAAQQQAHTLYTPLPNGFAYDHNKIIGFQNKESNEYALNVLKGQSLPVTVATISQTPPNAHPQYSQPPPPMHVAPPQSFHPGPPQFILRAPQPVAPYGIPTMDGGSFNWKVGDHCLAKYWDDGRYYEAEITGLSDKTCVVLFMGYGNYEEVLKSDCLPISNTNPTLVATAPHQLPLPPPPQVMQQQQSMHAIHAQSNSQRSSAPGQSSSSGRYRGERQMYVPPPKREA